MTSLLVGLSSLQAEVTVPSFFSDHMVLQRGMEVPVWGEASPGEEVQVTLESVTAATTADTSGKWKIGLDVKSLGPVVTSLIL